jgi:hypothetical protein
MPYFLGIGYIYFLLLLLNDFTRMSGVWDGRAACEFTHKDALTGKAPERCALNHSKGFYIFLFTICYSPGRR